MDLMTQDAPLTLPRSLPTLTPLPPPLPLRRLSSSTGGGRGRGRGGGVRPPRAVEPQPHLHPHPHPYDHIHSTPVIPVEQPWEVRQAWLRHVRPSALPAPNALYTWTEEGTGVLADARRCQVELGLFFMEEKEEEEEEEEEVEVEDYGRMDPRRDGRLASSSWKGRRFPRWMVRVYETNAEGEEVEEVEEDEEDEEDEEEVLGVGDEESRQHKIEKKHKKRGDCRTQEHPRPWAREAVVDAQMGVLIGDDHPDLIARARLHGQQAATASLALECDTPTTRARVSPRGEGEPPARSAALTVPETQDGSTPHQTRHTRSGSLSRASPPRSSPRFTKTPEIGGSSSPFPSGSPSPSFSPRSRASPQDPPSPAHASWRDRLAALREPRWGRPGLALLRADLEAHFETWNQRPLTDQDLDALELPELEGEEGHAIRGAIPPSWLVVKECKFAARASDGEGAAPQLMLRLEVERGKGGGGAKGAPRGRGKPHKKKGGGEPSSFWLGEEVMKRRADLCYLCWQFYQRRSKRVVAPGGGKERGKTKEKTKPSAAEIAKGITRKRHRHDGGVDG